MPDGDTATAVQVTVDLALAARIEQLINERDTIANKHRALAAKLRSVEQTLTATERCMDMMREATARLRPILRDGRVGEARDLIGWICAQRPEGWRP